MNDEVTTVVSATNALGDAVQIHVTVDMKKVEKAAIALANKVIHKGKNAATAAYGSIRIDIIRLR